MRHPGDAWLLSFDRGSPALQLEKTFNRLKNNKFTGFDAG
jgi:hypothetical protein